MISIYFEKLNIDLSPFPAFHVKIVLLTPKIRLILRLFLCLNCETITADEQKSTGKNISR